MECYFPSTECGGVPSTVKAANGDKVMLEHGGMEWILEGECNLLSIACDGLPHSPNTSYRESWSDWGSHPFGWGKWLVRIEIIPINPAMITSCHICIHDGFTSGICHHNCSKYLVFCYNHTIGCHHHICIRVVATFAAVAVLLLATPPPFFPHNGNWPSIPPPSQKHLSIVWPQWPHCLLPQISVERPFCCVNKAWLLNKLVGFDPLDCVRHSPCKVSLCITWDEVLQLYRVETNISQDDDIVDRTIVAKHSSSINTPESLGIFSATSHMQWGEVGSKVSPVNVAGISEVILSTNPRKVSYHILEAGKWFPCFSHCPININAFRALPQ